jgi:TolB-like protein/DNA-binding winged helix-turn-helix (wHTH) protein
MEKTPVGATRFGPFAIDYSTGELLKRGRKIRLQNQPFQILAMLLERPREIVTRETLRQKLWASDTFVDFDHGLNNAINRLREVLGDSAENARYIETLPRRGYRFIAPIEDGPLQLPRDSPLALQPPPSLTPELPLQLQQLPWRWSLKAVVLSLAALLLLSFLFAGWSYSRWGGPLLKSAGHGTISSVAVLPLENLTGDPAEDYLADGLTDALTTQLAQVRGLRVTSRTSAVQYKKQKEPLPRIARDLGVDAVVEGTLQRVGEHLSISLQLIEAKTDQHLWARNYERDSHQLPNWKTDAAQDIVRQVRPLFSLHDLGRLAPGQQIQSEAYDDYLRAQAYFGIQAKKENDAAIELLQKAVDLDSSFAAAYAQLGTAYGIRSDELEPQEKQWEEKSFAAIQKALQLDPDLAEAYVARGRLLWSLSNHFPHQQAAQDFHRALALNPNLAEAHHQLANVYNHIGLLDKAEKEIERAVALDPLNTGARFRVGVNLLYRGEFERSLLAIRDSQRFNPPLWAFQTSFALFQLGRREEARDRVHEFLKKYPEDSGGLLIGMQALLAAAGGDWRRAEERIRVTITKEQGYVHFHHTEYVIASAYALMNQTETALQYLQKAADDGFPCYPLFERDPNLASLRQNPRFIEFLAKQKKQWEYFKANLD